MPGLNRKGPEGQGPMTGRKMGRCTNFGAAIKEKDFNANPDIVDMEGGGYGRRERNGGGAGRGKGYGNRHSFRNGG